ncbi:MAG TPA: hypothetical protein VH063_01005 [Gaiellaceae bacterium]|jgi:hypothetical protein|nr:hypothetical protein [Gaiellaceae bacterium]
MNSIVQKPNAATHVSANDGVSDAEWITGVAGSSRFPPRFRGLVRLFGLPLD